MSNPLGWDLPAGCTDKDIDDHFGDPPMKECPTCLGDQEMEVDELDEMEVEHVELGRWQKLKNFFTPVWLTCPTCEGYGEVPKTDEDFQAEQEMYDDNELDL